MARTGGGGWIREGARQSAGDAPSDPAIARRFQTLLELGWLVASADGFADSERASLASLLERVVGSALDRATLELHFQDLEDGVERLGRRERLARRAADLDGLEAAEEAIGLVATIALADGVLSDPEHAVLTELGARVGLSAERVGTLVADAARQVQDGLR